MTTLRSVQVYGSPNIRLPRVVNINRSTIFSTRGEQPVEWKQVSLSRCLKRRKR